MCPSDLTSAAHLVWRVELRLPCRTMLRAHCREFSSDSLPSPPPFPLPPAALPNIVQLYRIWRDHLTGDGRALTRVELPATTEQ
uniref:Uncharacterized protein n=1 Tax=Timema douglasi TaxID=61478 RepID=A0A7R8Z7M5_TIMDO|nr:unnamed protein product [Timema douglasi]